ncbi:Xaa-Pro aminopeptidase [Microvirga flocculans]|uniref:Xaa-Pro aminopeptidase n=1 Tax=Microvirga flocculans TaxID=217168 RepID=A0A7W6ICG5_9HYPH|nr:Xaa-Pro peptidase family protein [Microvirga flocculans]MBB4038440.1 Xaa-Pro aminopeptidase [Microvirga flocculans]
MASTSNLARLQVHLRDQKIAALALGPGPHMQYVAGLRPHSDERPNLLVVTPRAAAFLVPTLEAADMRKSTDLPFFTYEDGQDPHAPLIALLNDLDIKAPARVQVDESMRADFALLFMRALQVSDVGLASESVGRLRQCKTSEEIAAIEANALIADEAMRKAFEAIRPGVTERHVAAAIASSFEAQGAKPLFGIVGGGENGAFPHHFTSDRVLKTGDAVVIDLAGRFGAFSSDITRMAHVGPPSTEYLQVHGIVERAVQAALKAAVPGAIAKTVDAAARNVIRDAGYGEYFTHRTGHGLGLEGHEPPYITAMSETVLEEGMVFSIEPGIYLPGRFGLRLEEIVVLEKNGPRILSRLSRDSVIC